MAQRNFRDRRAQKCHELELENEQLKKDNGADRSAWMEQLRQRDAENARLSTQLADANAKAVQIDLENRRLTERIAEMQRELGTFISPCCQTIIHLHSLCWRRKIFPYASNLLKLCLIESEAY